MPKNSKRRVRKRRVPRSLTVHKVVVRVQQGTTTTVGALNINADNDRTYRVMHLTFTVACVSTTLADHQSMTPQTVQVRILNQLGKTTATSGPVLIGTNPRVIRVRNSASTPDYDAGYSGNLVAVDGVCSFKGSEAYSLGTMTISVRYGLEEISEACPVTIGPQPSSSHVSGSSVSSVVSSFATLSIRTRSRSC